MTTIGYREVRRLHMALAEAGMGHIRLGFDGEGWFCFWVVSSDDPEGRLLTTAEKDALNRACLLVLGPGPCDDGGWDDGTDEEIFAPLERVV